MPRESKFTRGINPLCPDDSHWCARDEQSSEDEVNNFLYALIRLLKPKKVLETGCYLGDGTLAIAKALQDNLRESGLVSTFWTCDTDKERAFLVAQELWKQNLNGIGQSFQMTGLELIKMVGSQIDFAFIDSSPDGKVRGDEIKALIPLLRPNSMFALHDVAPQHPTIRKVYEEITLPKVYLNTPRGLALFCKP